MFGDDLLSNATIKGQCKWKLAIKQKEKTSCVLVLSDWSLLMAARA